MQNTLYSVEKISKMLGMHPKTIQRYIREGKLRAAKIGKAWRVSGHDLNLFTEGTSKAKGGTVPTTIKNSDDKIMISCVVDIDVTDMDEAMNISNMLTAAMNAKPAEYGKTTMNAHFIESELTLRVMLWGNVKFMKAMMWYFSNYVNK